MFIDSDTIPSPNLFSGIVKIFKNKNIVGAACKLYPIESDRSIRRLYKFYNKFMKLTIKLNKASIPGVCCIYRKSIFERIGGFDERLHTFEDVDFSLRANKLGKIVMLKDTFALTSGRRIKSWGAANAFISYLFNFFKFYLTGRGYTADQYKSIR